MKQEFSTKWTGSKRPGKQRKYAANAPLHLRKKFVSVHLSKTLRDKEGKRNVSVRKGDKVKVLRGKFRGKEGKVLEVKLKTGKVVVEGMQITKMDNSKVNVKLMPSNLQIIEMTERGKSIKKVSDKKTIEKKESEGVKKAESKSKSGENKK